MPDLQAFLKVIKMEFQYTSTPSHSCFKRKIMICLQETNYENYWPDDDLMNVSPHILSGTILLRYAIECLITREIFIIKNLSSR